LIPEGLKDEGTERIHSWVMLLFSWQLPTHGNGNGSCCQFQSNRRQEVRIFSALLFVCGMQPADASISVMTVDRSFVCNTNQFMADQRLNNFCPALCN